MRVSIPYGKTHLELENEDIKKVVYSNITKLKASQSEEELVKEAMENPIGSEKLKDLAKGKKDAVIIISDHTRPVPSKVILPFMLKELREGNPDIQISLLVATGCHRLTSKEELIAKLGEEIASSEKIIVHDCDKKEDMINLGTLPSGAELIINKKAVECDLLIAEGFIEPHFFAGFSGGRKSILPGICERKTVLGNHCSAFIADDKARMGVLEGNPIHRDMIAAVKMANLKYIVNVIINDKKEVVAAFAGDAIQAHEKGCQCLLGYCKCDATEKGDIVITSNGGAPLDQNAYQAVKGMTTAESFVKDNGVIIICSECIDGIGGEFFYEKMAKASSLDSLEKEILSTSMEETVPDQWQYQILVRIMKKATVIMISDEKIKAQIMEMKMQWASNLDEALEQAYKIVGENRDIIVIPDGVSVIGV